MKLKWDREVLMFYSLLLLVLTEAYPRAHRPRAMIYDNLVVFGDSWTDDGSEADRQSHGFNRFSNGPVWAEYLQRDMQSSEYQNFAYSGAKSGIDNYYFNGWSGVLWQIDTYLNANPVLSPDTLIILQLGGTNDLFNGDNKTAEIALNGKLAVEQLAEHGAQRLLALNLPAPLTPGFRNADPSLRADLSLLVAEANMKLQNVFYENSRGLARKYSKLKLKLFDLNGAFSEVINEFANVTDPFTHHRTDTRPEDVYHFAFYDLWHPSTFVHKKLSQRIIECIQDWT